MNRPPKLLLVSLLGLAAALGTSLPAQADVYKIVAPDGHVTYSDQKPGAEAQNQATVIGAAGTRRPLVAPPSAPTGPPKLYLPPPQAAEVASKQAIVNLGRGDAGRNPQLVEALIVANGYEILVQGYLDICAGTMPSSLGRFDATARAWREANEQTLKQAANLRANLFTTTQQAAIVAVAQSRANLVLVPTQEASTEPRVRWCDASTDALKSSLLSLGTKGGIVVGFERYVAH